MASFVPLAFSEYTPDEMDRRSRSFFAEMNQRRTVSYDVSRPLSANDSSTSRKLKVNRA